MLKMNIFKATTVIGCMVLMSASLQSCEDFLTVTPTDRIVEEDFWTDKNDVANVRAAAYRNLALNDVAYRVLVWGEFRSDNLRLNDVSHTEIAHLQNAVLAPTEAMFDWAAFYRGINYCNLALERGQRMIDENVDPSFTIGTWRPVRAELEALRALYYFYLVRAYRDVPYVEKAVTTDEEARNLRVGQVPGVAVLGDLITRLESVKDYAANNIGTSADNKGRFTRRAIRALLADMYLWRGCLLLNFEDKGATIINMGDETVGNKAIADNLAQTCFKNAETYCDWIIKDMRAEYDRKLADNATDEQKRQLFPMIQNTVSFAGTIDNVYNSIFGAKNSTESVLEIQYDGVDNINYPLSTYLSSASSSSYISPKIMVVNPAFVNVNTNEPTKGFGKTDFRLHETMQYSQTSSIYPCVKNISRTVFIQNYLDMAQGASYSPFRVTQDANMPIYRLSDILLMKAEAVARQLIASGGGKNTDAIFDAFDIVNTIFARNNPGLTDEDGEYHSERLKGLVTAQKTRPEGTARETGLYAWNKTASDLLTLVYQERQREFVGEGKFWFDIVRQCEASNDISGTLTAYMSVNNSVKNRLRHIYSLYNPIYDEEIKVNGVDNGGTLVQNPIWERYSKK